MHTIPTTRELLQNPSAIFANGQLYPGYFDSVKAGHLALAEKAWQHLAACHARLEEECIFDEPFVDRAEARQIVRDICQIYNRPAAADGVLASLYLQHRQRFLTAYQDFYCINGEYWFCCPSEDDDDECTMFSAYGYFGRSGSQGDIVDFECIDPEMVGFGCNCPVSDLWDQLALDQQLPLRLINYEAALKMVDRAICDTLAASASPLPKAWAVQSLQKWLLDLELNCDNPLPGIAIATHAILLQAL